MNTDQPACGWSMTARGMLPANLAAIALLIFGIINAIGLYLNYWTGGSLIFVFVLAYFAYLAGVAIERRNTA